MITLTGFALLATLLGADFAYSRTVGRHAAAWERRQQRDPEGVRLDSSAFSTGSGDIALLLVHGFGSSPAVFTRWAEELAARGYSCRAMRLPGFGEPLEAARRVDADDWRRALDEEIAALRRDHRQVWLVGHSMGAALCTDAAIRHPDQVDGLVLAAPLFGVSTRRSLGLPPERLFAVTRLLPFTDTLESCFPVDADDPSLSAVEARDVFVPLNIYRGMFDVMRAAKAAAPALGQPVLVLASERDRVVDFEAARRFAGRLRAPRAAFEAVSPAGHVLPLDTGWRALCGRVDDFIAGREPAS